MSGSVSRITFSAAALLGMLGSPAIAAEHMLMPTPKTVHIGYFLANPKPVLSIDSGDTVTLESTASIVPAGGDASGGVPASAGPPDHRDIYRTLRGRGAGPHRPTRPLGIQGARPGGRLAGPLLHGPPAP